MRKLLVITVMLAAALLASCTAPETPTGLSGSAENEALSVSIHAIMKPDTNQYKAEIVFKNKTDKEVSLLYDCGSLIASDTFRAKRDACLAVESMGLEGEHKVTYDLPEAFLRRDSVIKIKYRQDKAAGELNIRLNAAE
jgi:uncharacterized protein YcfL